MDIKALLDVFNSYWPQKLVELRPSKNIGSNEPWDLGDLWQPVSDWYSIKIFLILSLFELIKISIQILPMIFFSRYFNLSYHVLFIFVHVFLLSQD